MYDKCWKWGVVGIGSEFIRLVWEGRRGWGDGYRLGEGEGLGIVEEGRNFVGILVGLGSLGGGVLGEEDVSE